MIPLRDSLRSRRFPVVNLGLIGLSGFVFVKELSLSQAELSRLFAAYAVNPAEVAWALRHLSSEPATAWGALRTLITATFLHGGWLHLGGNMLYLWVFGDNVEDSLGHLRYLALYIAAGAVGFAAHSLLVAPATTPTLGASGAIAGVLGAYIVLFPENRVLTLIALGVFFQLVEVPAFVFLIVWFGMQLLSGVASLSEPGTANTVAWWAHVGGFATGIVLGIIFRQRRRPVGYWDIP